LRNFIIDFISKERKRTYLYERAREIKRKKEKREKERNKEREI
jgi:hypothetical protein